MMSKYFRASAQLWSRSANRVRCLSEKRVGPSIVRCSTALCSAERKSPAIGLDYTDHSLGSEWTTTSFSKEDGKYVISPMEFDSLRVPNVKGMNITDAVYLLENMGWNIAFEGYGKVMQQSVKPGDTLQPGRLITLTLGKQ